MEADFRYMNFFVALDPPPPAGMAHTPVRSIDRPRSNPPRPVHWQAQPPDRPLHRPLSLFMSLSVHVLFPVQPCHYSWTGPWAYRRTCACARLWGRTCACACPNARGCACHPSKLVGHSL